MLTANQAASQSLMALEDMRVELTKKLEEVINAACKQGSCRATFYPKNALQGQQAVDLLRANGFEVDEVGAKDQRDNDRIEIDWTERT